VNAFPRARIENLSVSRMIIGTNWFLGYSHTSKAKDKLICDTMSRKKIVDILEVFMDAGIDTIMGPLKPDLHLVIQEAQQRTGKKMIPVITPGFDLTPTGKDSNEHKLDECMQYGAAICMPHTCTTDSLVDKRAHRIIGLEGVLAMIRQRGMITGLSTHMPEVPVYADEANLDVATYIQIYNAIGFLMQIEIDWVHRMIWKAKKPVMTIKPLAAGKLMPLAGMAFVWSTLREQDMVTVGTSSADEAKELIEISLSVLERRECRTTLQWTRSKASLAATGN
jgi:hypothetical protein